MISLLQYKFIFKCQISFNILSKCVKYYQEINLNIKNRTYDPEV